MGIAWCMPELGNWDHEQAISKGYDFDGPGAPAQDMTKPLSHYFISSGHNS